MGLERHGARVWASSTGGPLLLIEERALGAWGGLDSGDYDRACAVSELVDTLGVGSATALVLGDEPAMTCAVSLPQGIALVRWHAADDVGAVDRAIDAITAQGATGEDASVVLDWNGPLVLFDSVEPGEEQTRFALEDRALGDGALRIELPPAKYRVELGALDPSVGSLSLVLLRRTA